MKYSKIVVLILFIFIADSLVAQTQKPKLTVHKVCAYIVKVGIEHPDIVLKQSVLETGWYKSKFLMSRNNLFGFVYKGKYMRFESWKKCVEYYKRWQKRHYKDPNEDYYAFLLRIKYANGETYNTALKNLILKNTCISN
jgi:uncharacterized FlgJ-related protein